MKVTSETLLDFEDIKKKPEENYRQFFERLLQHSRLHLAPANVKVDNIQTSTKDQMTISLMNFIALQWLRKIDIELIRIVKTEYSTELRANQQLADLVPIIAPNVDSLLARYSTGSAVSRVSTVSTSETPHAEDQAEHLRRLG